MNLLHLLFAEQPLTPPPGTPTGGHWFKILAVLVLSGLILRDLRNWSRSPASLIVRVLRLGVWIGAGVAITIPSLIQEVAWLLGIGRAADVVLYLFVLAFLWVSFFLYARCLRLEREITALTRHMAIRDAAREPATPTAESQLIKADQG